MQNIIAIENGVTRHPLYRMKEPVNMTLAAGEHIAVVGRNGAGKSILVDTITGRWPLLMNEVKYDFSPSPSIWMKLHWYVICCPKRPIQAWKRLCMNCLAWRGCWINISFCFPVVSYVSFN